MSPDQNPSPDGQSLPHRRRPSLEDPDEEAIDSDFWNLDDDFNPNNAEPPLQVVRMESHGHLAGGLPSDRQDALPANEATLPPTYAPRNRRRSSFSIYETVAVIGVALVLLGISSYFLITSLGDLPRLTDPYEKPALPASGLHLTIMAGDSYWRVPRTTGPDQDTVQRGTQLMPVLEITATSSGATLRVQFKNSEGVAVGDPITHSISGEKKLTIPSTAGLEDMNVHNAYRTGLIDPWTAEILEAPAGTTSGSAFTRLIAIPISPNRQ